MHKLINALGFQLGWWACIAGVGYGLEIQAMAFCAILVCTHLSFSKSPWQEIRLAGIALLLGIGIDSLLQYLSVIDFYGWVLGPLSPFWLWMLWVLFALTLNGSLVFLKKQPHLTSAILGMVFGPLTYVAGARLGAASLEVTSVHIFALASAWMLAMPMLVIAAKRTSHT